MMQGRKYKGTIKTFIFLLILVFLTVSVTPYQLYTNSGVAKADQAIEDPVLNTDLRNQINEIIVVYKNEQPGRFSINQESSAGTLVNVPKSQTVDEALQEVLKDPNVLYAEPNYIFTTQGIYDAPEYKPNDTYYDQQWGLEEVFAIDAWAFAEDLLNPVDKDPVIPSQVIVAVVDTGVDINHEDLINRVVPGKNLIIGALNSNNVMDDSTRGHGTHIAGIIASEVDNQIGIAGIAGSLPVKIMPVKVLDKTGTGTMYDISQGIRWAADNGAKIINLSLGARLVDYPMTLAQAVEYAQNKGALVIAAAGNNGAQNEDFYPAVLPGVLAVGATDQAHRNASFSNEYWNSVNFVRAPGVDILSTVPETTGKKYDSMSGTSQSAAYATGVAAIYMSVLPDLSPINISACIKDYTHSWKLTGTTYTSYNYILDAYRAFEYVKAGEGSDMYEMELLYPEYDMRVSGEIDLSVRVGDPNKIYKVEFVLFDSQYQSYPIATVTRGQDGGIPASGIVTVPFDTTKPLFYFDTELNTEQEYVIQDGEYDIAAISYDIDLNVLNQRWVRIMIVNSETGGLTVEVIKPDGTPGAKSRVVVIHTFEGPYDMIYETVWHGSAGMDGKAHIPSSLANGGNDFLIIAYGNEPSFFYYDTVRAPGHYILDDSDCQEVTFTASRIDGSPLNDAVLYLSLLQGSLHPMLNPYQPIYADTDNWNYVPLMIPIETFKGNGETKLTMTKGLYNFYSVHLNDRYILPRLQVDISETHASVDFSIEHAAILQFEPDEDAYAGELSLDLDEFQYSGIGFDNIRPHEQIVMGSGDYYISMDVIYRVPSGTGSSGTQWIYSYNPTIQLTQGVNVLRTGKPLASQLTLLSDQEQYQGDTFYFDYNIEDAYGNPVNYITKEPYTATAGASSVDSNHIMIKTPLAARSDQENKNVTKYYYDGEGNFVLKDAAKTYHPANCTIRDASGNIVKELTTYWFFFSWSTSDNPTREDYVLPGVYTAVASFDPGPMGDSTITSQPVYITILDGKDKPPNVEEEPDVKVTIKGIADLTNEEDLLIYKKDSTDVYAMYPHYDVNFGVSEGEGFIELYDLPLGEYFVCSSISGYLTYTEFTFDGTRLQVEIDGSSLEMTRVTLVPKDHEGNPFGKYFKEDENVVNPNTLPLTLSVNMVTQAGDVVIGKQFIPVNEEETAMFTFYVPKDQEYTFVISGDDDQYWNANPFLYQMTKKQIVDKPMMMDLGGMDLVPLNVTTVQPILNQWDSDFYVTKVALFPENLTHAPRLSPDYYGDYVGDEYIVHPGVIYVTPGTYRVNAVLSYKHYDGAWYYWLENILEVKKDTENPDAIMEWEIGNEFTLALELDQTGYGMGDKVVSSQKVSDEKGNRITAAVSASFEPYYDDFYDFNSHQTQSVDDELLEALDHYIIVPFFVVKDNLAKEKVRFKNYNRELTFENIRSWNAVLIQPSSRNEEPAVTVRPFLCNSYHSSEWVIPDDITGGVYSAEIEVGLNPGELLKQTQSFMINARPGAPIINLPVTRTNGTNIQVTGSTIPGATVKLFLGFNGNDAVSAGEVNADQTGSFAMEIPLAHEGVYAIYGYAVVDSVDGFVSEPIVLTVDRTSPGAPKDLSAEALDATHLKLTWNAPDDAQSDPISHYMVKRDGTVLVQTLTFLPGQVLAYTDNTASQDKQYLYEVFAVDLAGNISSAAQITAGTGGATDIVPPSAPSGVTVSYGNRTITVKWNPSTDNAVVAGYKVFRSVQGQEAVVVKTLEITDDVPNVTENLLYTDTDVVIETLYRYQVSAYDPTGNESEKSRSVEITTPTIGIASMSMNIPTLYNKGPVVPTSIVEIRLLGDTGYTGEFELEVLSIIDQDGNLLDQSVEKTLTAPMTDSDSTGLYKGSITLPEGITDILSVKGILKDQLQHVAYKETAVNKAVAGTIRVTVEPLPEAVSSLLSGMTVRAFSYDINYGSTLLLDHFKSYSLHVPQNDRYTVRIKDVFGLDMAGMNDVVVKKGQITDVSLTPQLPATLNVLLVEEDEVTPVIGAQVKVSGRRARETGVSDSSGYVVNSNTNSQPLLKDITGDAYISLTSNEFLHTYHLLNQSVTLKPGANEIKLVCLRKSMATIVGNVTNDLGLPIEGIQVDYSYWNGYSYINELTLSDGNGDYNIQIPMASDQKLIRLQASGRLYANLNKSVSINTGTVTVVDFMLEGLAKVDFDVLVNGEDPLDLLYGIGNNCTVTYHNITRNLVWKQPLYGPSMTIRGVYPGDTLNITVDGAQLNMTSQTITVVTDENNYALASIQIYQLGQIRAKIRHEDGKALTKNTWSAKFYNQGGNLALTHSETLALEGNITFKHMQDGIYKCVFSLQQPGNMIPGEDKSIVVEDVVIERGKITDIGNLVLRKPTNPVNETGWFTGDGNAFTTSTYTVVPGGTALLRADFNCPDFATSQIRNVTLTADIPDQMSILPDSVLVQATDGYANPILDYTLEYVKDGAGKTIGVRVLFGTISKGLKGRLLYMVTGDASLDWPVSRAEARMNYDTDAPTGGQIPIQRSNSLGVLEMEMPFVSIKAPKNTETDKFTVYGKAIPGATIRIMDEGQVVGEVLSTKYGYWETNIKLAEKGKPSIHYLTAVIDMEGTLIASERIRVNLVHEAVKLKKVTIKVNNGSTVEINPSFGVHKHSISWKPFQNTIYVTMDFSDNLGVYDVKLKTTSGYEQKAEYREGIWVVNAVFNAQVPGAISVSYKRVPKTWQTPDPNLTEEQIRETLPGIWADATVTVDVTQLTEQGIRAQNTTPPQTASAVVSMDSTGNMKMNMNMSVESAMYQMTDNDMKQAGKGVPPVYGFISNYRIEGNKLIFSLQGYIPDAYALGQSTDQLYSAAYETPAKLVKVFGDTAFDGGMGLQELFGTFKNAYDYTKDLNKLEGLLDKATGSCNSNASSYYTDLLNIQAKSLLSNLCVKYATTLIGIGLTASGVGALGGIAVSLASAAFGEYMDYKWDQEVDQIAQMIATDDDCKDDEDDDNDDDRDDDDDDRDDDDDSGEIANPKYFIDPSGYVYEAIPDNRIEGVITTIYEQDSGTGNWHEWDASEGEQMNPLVTDEEGRYAWDVPIGRWKVLYQKNGYRSVESYEMDVPPPHLDVNIGLITTNPPHVTAITAIGGGEGVLVTFDKYMRKETVSDLTVTVATTDKDEFGNPVYITGTVASLPEDTVDNLAVPGGKLSRTFKFTPTTGNLTVGNSYIVTVSKIVQHYGDIMMGTDQTQTVTVPVRTSPQSVTTDKNQLKLVLTDKVRLTATVLPDEVDNKSVTWTSSNSGVATVDVLGNVTAIGVGSTRITVTTVEGNETSYCDVTVNTIVTGISLDKAQLKLRKGESESLTATVLPLNASDKSLTWTTSNEAVATVSSNGTVYATGVGNASITATTNIGGKTATCVVTVDSAASPPVSTEPGIIVPISQYMMVLRPGAQTVTLFGGALVLEIPEGAFAEDVKLTVRMTPNSYVQTGYGTMEGAKIIGNVYEIDFGGQVAKRYIKIIENLSTGTLGNSLTEKAGFFVETKPDEWTYVGSSMNVDTGRVWGFIKNGGTYGLMVYNRTFHDIENHWSREDVEIMAAKQIINGYDGTHFAPERTVSRAEFAKMVVQALLTNPYYKIKMTDLVRPLFVDVHEKAWYRPYVDTAAYYNIIQGSGEGLFRPNDPITRQEIAVMLIRVMNSEEEVQWMKDQYEAGYITATFKDMDDVSVWATGSVLLAQQKGIFKGDQNRNLRPKDYVTRAEAAVVLRRTMALQGLLYTPKTIKGLLSISKVEVEHLELKTSGAQGETYVIIPSDDIMKNKLMMYIDQEVVLTGFEEDQPFIFIKKMFKALAIGDKIELYCWRCEQKKLEMKQ